MSRKLHGRLGRMLIAILLLQSFAVGAVAGPFTGEDPLAVSAHLQCIDEDGMSDELMPDACADECCSCAGGSTAPIVPSQPAVASIGGSVLSPADRFVRAGHVDLPFRPPIRS